MSVIFPDTGHVYLPAMWARMVDWMETNLMDPGERADSKAAAGR